ncbi:MAG: hypothetical protein WKG01_26955 [Kofleriaceae bacterium]
MDMDISRLTLGGVLAASVASLTLSIMGFVSRPDRAAPARFDRLTVERLDIVEPDGTPRMIVASRARFPGSFVRGKEIARPDRNEVAGILFVNDEGTESGGLIHSGRLVDNSAVAGASLTFDRFRQDQMLQLVVDEGGGKAGAGLIINDRPSHTVYSIEDMFAHPDRELPAQAKGAQRAFLGNENGTAALVLSDPAGRPRLALVVNASGAPEITMLDEHGKAIKTITP